MDLTLSDARQWINKNWYGLPIAYAIVFIVTYGTIWFFIEPMDIQGDKQFDILTSVLNSRWGNQILLCLIVAPHITLLFVLLGKFNNFEKKTKSNYLYKGSQPINSDFNIEKSQRWDIRQQKGVGNKGEGEFSIIGNIISIRRTNEEGEIRVNLVNYTINSQRYAYVGKDITKHGRRKVQVVCSVKLSGGGSQEICFVIKNKNTGIWIENAKIIVEGNSWIPVNLNFTPSYDLDFYLRIDSRAVLESPNSVEIENLQVIEN